ncbi:substrate-binding periplasmic protein [Chitinimonas lacunae]|uniref:Substrate-binding periplasmic protein n=1 Tax=Chitinimonas lacunae TaxID=1963018 RepID=A0ABV8MYC2_9NEIS
MKPSWLSILWLCAVAAQADSVTLGVEDDWAPYAAKVGNEAHGFAVDLVRAAYEAVGVEVSLVALPYARCMAEARVGKLVGCFDAARNSLLEERYFWHRQPLFRARVQIYAPSHSRDSDLTLRQLEGRVVGVTNGYEYGEEFERNPRILRSVSNRDEHSFRKLLARRVDYVIAYEKVAEYLMAENAADFRGRFKPVGVVTEAGLYIAFSKKHPDAPHYLEKFNRGLDAIMRNGKYRQIEASWK